MLCLQRLAFGANSRFCVGDLLAKELAVMLEPAYISKVYDNVLTIPSHGRNTIQVRFPVV
jgi:hypothetical protein